MSTLSTRALSGVTELPRPAVCPNPCVGPATIGKTPVAILVGDIRHAHLLRARSSGRYLIVVIGVDRPRTDERAPG